MMKMINYIPDVNKYSLAHPPQWWLKQLWSYDPSLVVIPSRQHPLFRLAQKRPLTLTMKMINDKLFNFSDTQMLANYGLIPVTTIRGDANWSNPAMWKELNERAPWRMGGAEKVADALDEFDLEQEQRVKRETDQMLTDRAKDGWRLLQYKTGQRTFISNHRIIPRVHTLKKGNPSITL